MNWKTEWRKVTCTMYHVPCTVYHHSVCYFRCLSIMMTVCWLLLQIKEFDSHVKRGNDLYSGAREGPTPKQRLLLWVQNKVPELPIKNFTTDWNDGKAIGALVDAVGPGKIVMPLQAVFVSIHRQMFDMEKVIATCLFQLVIIHNSCSSNE